MMRYLWSIIGILISITASIHFLKFLPENLFEKVYTHTYAFSFGFMVLSLAYVFRALKTLILLDEPSTSRMQITGSLFASIALNNILPFRLGDLLRLFYLRTLLAISLPKTTSALVIERLTDLAMILLLFCLSVLFLNDAGWKLYLYVIESVPIWISAVIVLLLISVFVYLVWFRSTAWKIYQSTVGSLSLTAKRLACFLIATFLQWILEIISLAWILSAFMDGVPKTEAIFSSFMSNLSTLVPSAPGYIGTFEVAGIIPFQLFLGQVTTEQALFVVIYHLVIWCFSSILGIGCLLVLLIVDRKIILKNFF